MPELYWSDTDDQWLPTRRGVLLDEDGLPPVTDVYFADTDDAHTAQGDIPGYDGPSEGEIRSVWDALTEKQRFVIGRLRGLNGDGHQYTHREIASTLGISHVATVKIEQRALAHLRLLLDDRLLAA